MIAKLDSYFAKYPPQLQGIYHMIMASFWFSVMATLIRFLSDDMSTFQMVFLRNFFALILIMPWALKAGIKHALPTRWNLYWYRSISGVLGMFMFFYGLSIVPLPEAVSLTFITPIISTLFAVFFLMEKVGRQRWIAMLIGFVGVLVILRPGSSVFQPAALLIVATAFTWSASNIFLKKMTVDDDPKKIIFVTMCMMSCLALPPALFAWNALTVEALLWLVLMAWVTNQAMLSVTNSFAKTDMNIVLPFDFFRLIFITIFAFFCFGEVIDLVTAIGALIIFASGTFVAIRSKKDTSGAETV